MNMKRKLNEAVKGREWYRPYAPVVRQEDQAEYFEIDGPVPYMSIIGFTRPEWKSRLAAVTHVDGSARLQTVTRQQSPFLWELLGEMKRITGVGVLLNTSFNGRGEPMISEIRDALRLLDETGLDAVYCEGWLFQKRSDDVRRDQGSHLPEAAASRP
jgi:predicted NodU family carbamoyl transferase